MLTRRNVLGAAMTSAWGGRQVRRIDQRPRQKSAAGSGPAPSSAIIIARVIIVKGSAGGVFIYDSAGNLVDSMAFQANVDPLTHSNLAGTVSYLTGASFSQLISGSVELGSLNPASLVTQAAFLNFSDALAAIAQPSVTITSPRANAAPAGRAGVVILGESNDGSHPSQVVIGATPLPAKTIALVEVQGSQAVGKTLGSIREWYAPSGGDDFAALNTALSSYGSADLLPAAYQLSANLSVAGATLQGCDEATTLSPFGAYAGVLMTAGTKGAIRNLSVTNGGADAIQIAAGITDPWLLDLYFASNAGRCISAPSVTGPLHARIRGIRGAGGGSANGGGILLDGGTGGAITCEANIYDLDIQGLTASEVLRIQGVTDVLVSKVNGSIASGVASNAISVLGACQTVHLLGLDVGGSASTNATCFVGAGTSVNSPTDCRIEGKLQTGQSGLFVSDAVSRSRFYVDCTRNQLDGARFNDTGTSNKLMYMGNVNNQSAGVAYDINVQNTGHLYIDGPQYGTPGGGAVTANLNCAIAGNHVTHNNPPAGSTNVGFAPAGW